MPLLGKKKQKNLSVDESKSKRWSFGRKKKTLGDDISAPPSPLTPSAQSSTFPSSALAPSPSPSPAPSSLNQSQELNSYALGRDGNVSPVSPITPEEPTATQQLSPPPSAGLYPPASYGNHSRKSSTASFPRELLDANGDSSEGGYINGGYVNPYANPYLTSKPGESSSPNPVRTSIGGDSLRDNPYRTSMDNPYRTSIDNPYRTSLDKPYRTSLDYRSSSPASPTTNTFLNPYSTTNNGDDRRSSYAGSIRNDYPSQQQQLLMREEEEVAGRRGSHTGSTSRLSMGYDRSQPTSRLSMSYEPSQQDDQLLIREEEQRKESPSINLYGTGYGANRLSQRYSSNRYSTSSYNPYSDLAYRQAQDDEEEEDVEAIKQEIRFVKQETVSSTRNAIRAGMQAEEAGRDTLMRLGQQGEQLHSAEKSLDIAHSKNRTAADQARELKTLNRSMFAVHVKNPFNSKERQEERERNILERHDSDVAAREETRKFGYGSTQVSNKLNLKGNPMAASASARNRMSLIERSKYQFEADQSDDEKEQEIEENLDQIGQIAGRLKTLAVTTGEELDRQNKQLGIVAEKVRCLDEGRKGVG
jgi:hypothetical protein